MSSLRLVDPTFSTILRLSIRLFPARCACVLIKSFALFHHDIINHIQSAQVSFDAVQLFDFDCLCSTYFVPSWSDHHPPHLSHPDHQNMSSNIVNQDMERQASTLAFENIEQDIGVYLAGKDPEVVDVIKKHIKEMDADGDGRITSPELARYSTNLVDEVMATKANNRRLKWFAGGATGLIVLLSGGVFGSSAAAAFLAKDTHVEADRVSAPSRCVFLQRRRILMPIC